MTLWALMLVLAHAPQAGTPAARYRPVSRPWLVQRVSDGTRLAAAALLPGFLVAWDVYKAGEFCTSGQHFDARGTPRRPPFQACQECLVMQVLPFASGHAVILTQAYSSR
jgi:hypothetical protein